MYRLSRCLASAFAFAALASRLLAVDGVVLIDQNRALAGNVTPGDAPGFPIRISVPGSYRLSGNLTVPNVNTSAILLATSHVTIDLNGFAILGPVDCSGGFPCAGAPPGPNAVGAPGIMLEGEGPLFNIAIRNGIIQGMGGEAIRLVGDSNLVEYIYARSNVAGFSLLASADAGASTVQHCTLQRNGLGIIITNGRVSNNTIFGNNTFGIAITGRGLITDNVIDRNGIALLMVGTAAGYRSNVLSGTGAVTPQGGVSLGPNLCNGVLCP